VIINIMAITKKRTDIPFEFTKLNSFNCFYLFPISKEVFINKPIGIG
jgi:hypothetical protein